MMKFALAIMTGDNRAAIDLFDRFYPEYTEKFRMKYFLPGMWAMKAEAYVALEQAEAALEIENDNGMRMNLSGISK